MVRPRIGFAVTDRVLRKCGMGLLSVVTTVGRLATAAESGRGRFGINRLF